MKIIPAIDIIDGKCVRLSQGDYTQKIVYNENPLEVAKKFEAHGIRFLHLVDLDGAKTSKVVNLKVLEKLASQTNLSIDFGGGVKSDEDINAVFNAGAQQVTAGSIAVKSPETVLRWTQEFGAERIILGADLKNNKIATHGWTETSEQELIPFIMSFLDKGIHQVICTDVSKDGMLEGTAEVLYAKIIDEIPKIQLIASGGLRSVDELYRLKNMGVYGTIIGKALYENKIALKDLEQFILNN